MAPAVPHAARVALAMLRARVLGRFAAPVPPQAPSHVPGAYQLANAPQGTYVPAQRIPAHWAHVAGSAHAAGWQMAIGNGRKRQFVTL